MKDHIFLYLCLSYNCIHIAQQKDGVRALKYLSNFLMLQTASPFLAQKLKQRSTHYDAYVGAQVHIMIIKLRKLHYTHVFQ